MSVMHLLLESEHIHLIEALDHWAHTQCDFMDFPIFDPQSDCGVVEQSDLAESLDVILSLQELISSATIVIVKEKQA